MDLTGGGEGDGGAEQQNQDAGTAAAAAATATAREQADNATILVEDFETPSSSSITAVIDLCSTSPSTSKPTTAAAASGTTSQQGHVEPSGSATTIECPICLQTCIHPARLPCGHIFCFLCVKGVAYKNRRCAMCRREIPPEFLDHPELVNGINDICVTKATEDGYQWFYEGRNGWWQYDDRTSQDIEEAYKKGEKSCIILVAGYVYVVDLESMVQQRQNEPSRCRRVKRDLATIPKKGVAGLRIEGNTVTTDSNFASHVYEQSQSQSGTNQPAIDSSLDLGLPMNYYSMRHPANASDFISTIAATDAAIRIASDIIGSTLAHADELSRSRTGAISRTSPATESAQAASEATETYNTDGSLQASGSGSATSGQSVAHGSRELLGAAEDLLDATQNVIAEADQHTIDLFEQTLNDFHALTLRNLVNSSDEEDGGDPVALFSQRLNRF